jgi:two-component system KDP operon response regulator KdpE
VAKILVIDDDPSLLRALRLGLHSAGHEVATALNGAQRMMAAAQCAPDVVILDLGLPDVDGLEVCRRIRLWSSVPIVVLSAIDAEDRKIAALDGGANDYVTKPFGLGELAARIRVAIRGSAPLDLRRRPTSIVLGELELDVVRREARVRGRSLELTAKEIDVLVFLARNADRTCTHEMILSAVWGPGYAKESQYLHAYIHRLRQKLHDRAGQFIRTAPGIGYVLVSARGPGSGLFEPE